jgi:PQQ-like domain
MRSLAVIATVGVMSVAACKPSTKGHGNPKGAVFAREGGEVTLILADELSRGRSNYDSRIAAVDVKTGKVIAARAFDARLSLCAVDKAGALWCEIENEKLRRVNPRTLQAVPGEHGPPPELPSEHCADGSTIPVGSDFIEARSGDVQRIGKVTWRAKLERAGCQAYTVVDDLVVVAVDDSRNRALGIDIATGAIRWRVAF